MGERKRKTAYKAGKEAAAKNYKEDLKTLRVSMKAAFDKLDSQMERKVKNAREAWFYRHKRTAAAMVKGAPAAGKE
jgi:predicted kinase